MKLSEMTVHELIGALKYQTLTPSVTTMGQCLQACGLSSRGSGYCAICIGQELAERGNFKAARLVWCLQEAGRLIWEAEADAE